MSEPEMRARHRRAPLGQMLAIGAITSVLGIVLALLIDWFPVQASGEARSIDTLWDVLLIASVPVFVLVATVVIYCAVRFRMRPGEELEDGPPIHGNTRLEIIWTAIPAILLVGLCTYAYVVLRDIEEARADTMQVRVVGEQFTWNFYYDDGSGEELRSSELYLPVDRRVRFLVQSKDVIHDFWVPAFRMKIDAVPGIETEVGATLEREGTYPVVCAELCGLGHAVMRQSANVVSQAEYDDWMAQLREGGEEEQADTETTDPEQLFTAAAQPQACGACHTLAAAGTDAETGPSLDEAVPDMSPEELRTAIVDPDAEVAEGYTPGIMPAYGESLSDEQVDALVDYLTEVSGR